LTSIQSVLAAFIIILVDLLGRAGLDKVLALAGGPTMVALWAQLQSVVELVSAVTMAGVLQGLTVLVTQVNTSRDERSLLRDAFKLALGTSLAVALIVALFALLVTWVSLVFVCYMGIYWTLGHGALSSRDVFTISGSAIFTLGFATTKDLPSIAAVFSEASLGLGLLALLITYLPSLYGSFSRREAAVTALEVRAGSPPSGAARPPAVARSVSFIPAP